MKIEKGDQANPLPGDCDLGWLAQAKWTWYVRCQLNTTDAETKSSFLLYRLITLLSLNRRHANLPGQTTYFSSWLRTSLPVICLINFPSYDDFQLNVIIHFVLIT